MLTILSTLWLNLTDMQRHFSFAALAYFFLAVCSAPRHQLAAADEPMNIGNGDPRVPREADAALPREGQRVDLERADVRPREDEIEQLGDILVVQAQRDGGEDRRRHVVLLEQIEHLELTLYRVRAEHLLIDHRIERVEREHDARVALGKHLDVLRIFQLQPVRRDRQTTDARGARETKQLGEPRVERGLAPREVDDVQIVVLRNNTFVPLTLAE